MNNSIPKKIWTLWLNFNKHENGILTSDLEFFVNRIKFLHPVSESESWEVNVITKFDDLYSLINNKETTNKFIIDVIKNKFIGPAHKSDLIRYYLLKTYGGYWIDISTFLIFSLDQMKITKDSSFVCYYAPTIDVSEWLFSSLGNMYESINYKDRIEKWTVIEDNFIKLKDSYKQKLNVMPENYFIGAKIEHEIINNVFNLLKTFWSSNIDTLNDEQLGEIEGKKILCNIQSKYIYELIVKIYNINKLSLIPLLDFTLIETFDVDKTDAIDKLIINKSIADCGYLFNYLQLYIGIYKYLTNKHNITDTNIHIRNKLDIPYEKDLCINDNCNDLIINITNNESTDLVDKIVLLSATFNRLGKWSDSRNERLSYDNTYIGEKIKTIMDKETALQVLKEFESKNFFQLKFGAYTRNSKIIPKLKQWYNNNNYVSNQDNMNGTNGTNNIFKNKYIKYKNKYLKLKNKEKNNLN